MAKLGSLATKTTPKTSTPKHGTRLNSRAIKDITHRKGRRTKTAILDIQYAKDLRPTRIGKLLNPLRKYEGFEWRIFTGQTTDDVREVGTAIEAVNSKYNFGFEISSVTGLSQGYVRIRGKDERS